MTGHAVLITAGLTLILEAGNIESWETATRAAKDDMF